MDVANMIHICSFIYIIFFKYVRRFTKWSSFNNLEFSRSYFTFQALQD